MSVEQSRQSVSKVSQKIAEFTVELNLVTHFGDLCTIYRAVSVSSGKALLTSCRNAR